MQNLDVLGVCWEEDATSLCNSSSKQQQDDVDLRGYMQTFRSCTVCKSAEWAHIVTWEPGAFGRERSVGPWFAGQFRKQTGHAVRNLTPILQGEIACGPCRGRSETRSLGEAPGFCGPFIVLLLLLRSQEDFAHKRDLNYSWSSHSSSRIRRCSVHKYVKRRAYVMWSAI